jgi:hypothetical protein
VGSTGVHVGGNVGVGPNVRLGVGVLPAVPVGRGDPVGNGVHVGTAVWVAARVGSGVGIDSAATAVGVSGWVGKRPLTSDGETNTTRYARATNNVSPSVTQVNRRHN